MNDSKATGFTGATANRKPKNPNKLNDSRKMAWSDQPSLQGLGKNKDQSQDVSYYSDGEESEYYDEEEGDAVEDLQEPVKAEVVKVAVKVEESSLDKGKKAVVFDPRRDKLLDITVDSDSNFE